MDEPIISPEAPAALSNFPTKIDAFTPVAPYWHTALVVVIMAAVGILSAKTFELRGASASGPLGQYLSTMLWLWLLSALVYMGLRRGGVTVREVIGGDWKSFDEILIDLAIAGGFWLTSAIALAVLKLIFMRGQLANIQTLPEQAKSLAPIIPHTPREMIFWVLLSFTAGFCEEFVFRGYLQRQCSALTRNAAAGIALSALFFSIGHLYQGFSQMIFIGIYGAMFGVLAHFRKSLRPGMIAHAWQDTLAGLALGLLLPHAVK
jgi:membrane protease YdiL (CAAX protease family)